MEANGNDNSIILQNMQKANASVVLYDSSQKKCNVVTDIFVQHTFISVALSSELMLLCY